MYQVVCNHCKKEIVEDIKVIYSKEFVSLEKVDGAYQIYIADTDIHICKDCMKEAQEHLKFFIN